MFTLGRHRFVSCVHPPVSPSRKMLPLQIFKDFRYRHHTCWGDAQYYERHFLSKCLRSTYFVRFAKLWNNPWWVWNRSEGCNSLIFQVSALNWVGVWVLPRSRPIFQTALLGHFGGAIEHYFSILSLRRGCCRSLNVLISRLSKSTQHFISILTRQVVSILGTLKDDLFFCGFFCSTTNTRWRFVESRIFAVYVIIQL